MWLPWFCLTSEQLVLQFLLVYSLFSLFYSLSFLQALLSLLNLIFLFGLQLSFFQLGLFIGFFWVIELTVIFILVLLVLYLNTKFFMQHKPIIALSFRYKFTVALSLFLVAAPLTVSTASFLQNILFYSVPYDNYYASLWCLQRNDFIGLFFSYYFLNSIAFLLVGSLLFIGSLVCVNLNASLKKNCKSSEASFSKTFSFFSYYTNYLVLRRQNLNLQSSSKANTKATLKKNGTKKFNSHSI